MSETKYKRVLIKISGEEFAAGKKFGIDADFLNWVAGEVKKVADLGVEVAVVVGGGNFVRGKDYEGQGVERATADHMGMLSGIVNGLALHDTIQGTGQSVKIMSRLNMEQVAETFVRRKALHYLEKGNVVLLVAGTGQPYYTHDMAAVTGALELDCEVMLKATKVDGVFSENPENNPDAEFYPAIDFQTAVENPQIKVMDKAALGLAMEQKMPVKIFKLKQDDNFKRVVLGEQIGTDIS